MQQPQTVLLIGPADDSREMYSEFLRWCGFAVLNADTTDDGLKRAADADVIVTEIRVPGSCDRVELVRRVRNAGTTCHTLVIVLTSSVFHAHRERALAAGCDVFCRHPVCRNCSSVQFNACSCPPNAHATGSGCATSAHNTITPHLDERLIDFYFRRAVQLTMTLMGRVAGSAIGASGRGIRKRLPSGVTASRGRNRLGMRNTDSLNQTASGECPHRKVVPSGLIGMAIKSRVWLGM